MDGATSDVTCLHSHCTETRIHGQICITLTLTLKLILLLASISIAFGVSFNLNLQSQSPWSLFNGMWQKRHRELEHRLRFETGEMSLQMH